jgi:PhoPQ-activated pathogenicity-related protein
LKIKLIIKIIIETVTVKPIWWHYLAITIPDRITRPDAGFLLIEGGSTDSGYKSVINFIDLYFLFQQNQLKKKDFPAQRTITFW